MQVRQMIAQIELDMNQPQGKFDPYAAILENNFIF